jgi:3-oxoacyl-[acyl-carrier protein] reductase
LEHASSGEFWVLHVHRICTVSNTVRAAVANWSKTLAGEVAKYGITVNNVLPGATNTQRLRSLIDAKAQKTGQHPDEIKAI